MVGGFCKACKRAGSTQNRARQQPDLSVFRQPPVKGYAEVEDRPQDQSVLSPSLERS
jgi:hypothetical protein